jgi:outer membrane protein
MKIPAVILLCALTCAAETRTLTLKQALEIALQQNPDLVIARLDQQKAREQVSINRGPFSPKVYAGSGAAWTYGFPTSIDGSAPSIVQVKTSMSLYDKSQSYLVAQAQELARGAGIGVEQRQAEVIYRVASLFIDVQNAARGLDAARQEDAILARMKQLTQARVDEGEQLTHDSRKANIAELDAAHRIQMLDRDVASAERSLATALGLAPGDRVRAAEEQLPALEPPVAEAEAVAAALSNSPELKRLESDLQAKTLETKSYKAYRLPKVDLVAQYALLAKFNNYTEYFQRFQWNNAELGASFSIPVLAGRSSKAYVTSSEIDAAKIRAQIGQVRARIQSDIENAFDDLRVAEDGRKLALEDLGVTRESTTLDLARQSEGQVLPAQVEQDRAEEQQKWRAYYDAQAAAQHARLNVLRMTGTLQEALK